MYIFENTVNMFLALLPELLFLKVTPYITKVPWSIFKVNELEATFSVNKVSVKEEL